MKFVPKGPINNIPAMVQIMAWRRPGDKPLSEPMVVSLLMHICVARPQWVNIWSCDFKTSQDLMRKYISTWWIHTLGKTRTTCVHKWGQYTLALLINCLIQKYSTKIPILLSSWYYTGVKPSTKLCFQKNSDIDLPTGGSWDKNSGTPPFRENIRHHKSCNWW